ncbi:MAG: hypothetical protein ACT4QF_02920 [Sporichthyaceae bacterium]
MTPWNAAILHTANALTVLLSEPPGRVDLDVAVTARAAVLDHVSTVLADLVPRTRTRHARPLGRAVPVSLIEADPLDGLGRVLHGRLRPLLDKAPSELLDTRRRVDPATALWVDAGRHALVATREWSRLAAGVGEPERTWQIVGEVSALLEAVAVLDRDLVAQAGEGHWVRQVVESTAGVGIAAREVLALAGQDCAARPEAPSNDAAAITAALAGSAGRPATLSKDVRRLTVLLDQTPTLAPHHVRACARVGRGLERVP